MDNSHKKQKNLILLKTFCFGLTRFVFHVILTGKWGFGDV